MQQIASHAATTPRRETVILLGGKGGFASRYRAIAEEHGYELEHYEQRVPPRASAGRDRVALVLVIVSMISHSLRDQAQRLAGASAAVVYVRRPSVSAVRESLRLARAAEPQSMPLDGERRRAA